MSSHATKKVKLNSGRIYRKQTGRIYHDLIPLEDDFEVVEARTISCSGPNGLAVETEQASYAASWNFGSSWAPEDNLDFALDPDGEWYDEALEADIADTMVDTLTSKGKKRIKRNQISVRLHDFPLTYLLTTVQYFLSGQATCLLENARTRYLSR